jgi:NADPH-dependent curcumin reductase CurA
MRSQRLILSYHITDSRSYAPPVQIGELMRGSSIGIIKASKSDKLPVGTLAVGYVGWREFAVVKDSQLTKAEIPTNGKLTDLLGVLGM